MRRIGVVLIVVLGVLAVMLVRLPATWFDYALHRTSSGVLGLAAASGTVWEGRGVLQAVLPGGTAHTVEPVRWRFEPWALLAGRARLLVLSERDGKPVLDLVAGLRRIDVVDARVELPAAIVGAFSATLREASVAGRLALKVTDLRVDDGRYAGEAELLWSEASSALTSVAPLGDYRLALQGAGRGIDFRITTLRGALGLNGGGSWQPDSGLALDTLAVPAEEQRSRLEPLLRVIGRETAPGSYRLVVDRNVGMTGTQ